MSIKKPDKNPWLIRIYKITSTALNSDWCYVGQTVQTLEKRWKKHEKDFRKWIRTDKRSTKIMWFEKAVELEDLELETFKIELLEETQVSSKRETRLLEGKWMRLLNSCNKNKPKEIQPDDPDTVRIYKITTSLDMRFCYVGQTVKILKKRWIRHKSEFKNWIKNERITGKCAWFEKAFELNDLDLKTFKIELLEESTFITDGDKDALERKWMDILDCCNINKPGRTQQERNKKYREDNKDKIREENKKYREENKDKIKEQKTKKHDCICGIKYTNGHKSRHEKTKKHQEYINQIN